MRRDLLKTSLVALLLCAGVAGQTQEAGFLDVLTVKVKPEKRSEFDAAVKKMVAANRQNKGSNWTASGTVFGDRNTLYFTSSRASFADIESDNQMFMASLAKALGPAGVPKLMQELGNCTESSRGELRRLRLDLSRNASADRVERAKLSGKSPWRRIFIARIRPGHTNDYLEAIRMLNATLAKDLQSRQLTTYVSQGVGGQTGVVFYTTTLASTLADLSPPTASLAQLMGDTGYQKYVKILREAVISNESIITRVIPELSNPTEDMASAAPEFWKPRTAVSR